MDIFGTKTKDKIASLEEVNQELQAKTAGLVKENSKLNSLYHSLSFYTGENTVGELGAPTEVVIDYDALRVRSWEFIIKNHLVNLIATKRVNWTIGSGLTFNAKPSLKPFLDYYGSEDKAKAAQKKFIISSEYLFRNYAKTTLPDYAGNKNLHELAREVDYNSIGDGDVLLVARVANKMPTIQPVSGQVVMNPYISDSIIKNNRIQEGVEYNKKNKVVAYHVQKQENTSNTPIVGNIGENLEFGTKRVKAYFSGTDIRSAWLYKTSDLQKLGETRALPAFSHTFETFKHLNDYLIANAKNAHLMSQLVMSLEKGKESDGDRVFDNVDVSILGSPDSSSDVSEIDCASSAANAEMKLKGNGVVLDLPKGVSAKQINAQAQTNQDGYLRSTLQTVSASSGIPYEVLISAYNSNYTASMGARSDYQFNLDVLTEITPANQFYRKVWELFVYVQILSGDIDCPPLLQAYNTGDKLTIQSIINSHFAGTKLKPIDPLKFIKSLRAKLPESIREDLPLDTLEEIVMDASGQDYEGVITQVDNELEQIPESLKTETIEPV